jgi:lysozyme
MRARTIGAGVSLSLVLAYIVPIIAQEEGVRYRAYHDIGNIMTVCSGHTGPDVVVGKVYTPDQCKALTLRDAQIAADGVLKYSPNLINHPKQLASAISFSYNVGVGTYEHSSVRRDFNASKFSQGCDDLLKYDRAGGVYSVGLHNRRLEEWKICRSDL